MADPERPNPYAVPLGDLEDDAHVAPEKRLEEIAEAPGPDLIAEERRRLESFLKYGQG